MDHCFISKFQKNFTIVSSDYIDDDINLSDHKPLVIIILLNNNFSTNNSINVDMQNCNKIIKLPPNFDNQEVYDKFNTLIMNNMQEYVNQPIEDVLNKQAIINIMYSQLSSVIRSTYDSCSRVVSVNSINNSKVWFTNELKCIKSKMIEIRLINSKTIDETNELKSLKISFKKIMKRNIFLYEKNQFYKIGNLIKANNGKSFFKNVNAFLNKNKTCELDLDNVQAHYDSIFNEPINVNVERINEINIGIDNLVHDNYSCIDVSKVELNYAILKTSRSNVVGDDGLSSNMILNIRQIFNDSFLLYFFQFIFRYGVIPINFNNTHIVPIIKDKSKPLNDLANLRPISISNTLAQIFERIIRIKTPELGHTHQNQFGYKNKTSCTHALFAFKELIIKHIEEKKHIFAVQLDAVKAFDKLWREGLFFKLKNKVINLNTVILLRIYYDQLQSKVKINNMYSRCFKLTRGVKQGGVLSGDLFNIFIDDLINDCVNSGLGAKFVLIILCILCFCDDICLLSGSSDELRLLINICEEFARK